MSARLYHVSAEQGITRFHPRRFWHTRDLRASGRLADDAPVPPGMHASHSFFCGPWELTPCFFAPPELKRIGVLRSDRTRNLIGPEHCAGAGARTLVFAERDRPRLEAHRFSIYTFDVVGFRRISSGEAVAENPVAPVEEERYEDALEHMCRRNMAVAFVADIERAYRELIDANASFFLVRHVERAVRGALGAGAADSDRGMTFEHRAPISLAHDQG